MKNQVYKTIFAGLIICISICSASLKTTYAIASFNQGYYDSISDLYISIANNYIKTGDYRKALEATEKLHLYRKSVLSDTSSAITQSYINLALVNMNIYEYEKALRYLKEAETLCMHTGRNESEQIGSIYTQIGRIYKEKGDYTRAAQYFKRVDQLIDNHHLTNNKKLISYYLVSADLELIMGNTAASLELFNRCYKIIKTIENNNVLLVNYYIGYAIALAKAGKFDESIDLYYKAAEIAGSDTTGNPIELAMLYNNIGLDYLELNQLTMAEISLKKSLDIFSSLNVKGAYLAELYENYGRYYFLKGDYKKALQEYQKGLQYSTSATNLDNYFENPGISEIMALVPTLQLLKSKSYCLKELYLKDRTSSYLDAALNTAFLITDVIERMRNSFQSYESKMQIMQHEYDAYKNLLTFLHLADHLKASPEYKELLFNVSEKSKSSILLSVLHEMDARQFGGIPDSLIEKEKSLAKTITFYSEKIYEEKQNPYPDADKIALWEKYHFEASKNHAELITYLEKKFPKYHKLKYKNSVSSIVDLQKKLPRSTTMVEYSISDKMLYTIIINKNSAHVHEQQIDSSFFTSLNNYISKFHKFDFSRQNLNDFTDFCFTAQLLYNKLIAPTLEHISGNSLIIVPDGILAFLPFETLLKDIPDGIPESHYRYLSYLINDFSISYSYSATLFAENSGRLPKKAKKGLLALAPEYNGRSLDESITPYVTRQQYRKNLHPIPGVLDEVSAIHKLIKGDILTAHEATERNFREAAPDYDILHLAMHTIIDDKNPLYSKLIFTLDNDSVYDDLLNTYELFGLLFKARMVVLSACSTGEGKIKNGEGVLSLARGFAYAGTPSMLMTLWEVEDRTGSEIVKLYYKNLLKGQSKPKALQNAKLEIIKNSRPENTHPFFWSSFVILGNVQPLYSGIKPLLLFGGSLVAAMLILIFFIFRNQKNNH